MKEGSQPVKRLATFLVYMKLKKFKQDKKFLALQ